MNQSFRIVTLALLFTTLWGCGFKPVYQTKSIAELGSVTVERIPNRKGQILRNNLQQALALAPRQQPLYSLKVGLSEARRSGGIRLTGDLATRGTLTMTAAFNLLEIKSGTVLYGGRYQTFGSYDIVGNAYENAAARDHTRKILIDDISRNIVTRIGLFLKDPSFGEDKATAVDTDDNTETNNLEDYSNPGYDPTYESDIPTQ